jgi:hypothetical protein
MSIYDQYPDESLSRLAALEKELVELRANCTTLANQNQMLKGFISLSNVSSWICVRSAGGLGKRINGNYDLNALPTPSIYRSDG